MDGVFPFLKPPGITSHDAVGICRRLLHERRIGHSGTLDPLAYGVLPLYLGRATRLIEYAEGQDKTYIAECKLGFFTDTEDSTGQALPFSAVAPASQIEKETKSVTVEQIEAVLPRFRGAIEQTPSRYSAIKVNGQRAYEWARQGIVVTMPKRQVAISELSLVAFAYPFFTLKITCSSGTYVRALLRDICLALGLAGHMTQLVRTRVGAFTIDQAFTGEEVEVLQEKALLPADTVVAFLPKLDLSDDSVQALVRGQVRPIEQADGLYRTYGSHGFLGLAKVTNGQLKVEKNVFLP
ncbi:MAG: tRNA pseudouridine(55) synthase TruB [Veillonellaceae bacterium]|nr:tRNA pseudouridine(55) synthase TruB [Veillonellaceae bacterium]